eukprot:TRINITY_DN14260_c0_g1_i1.p1 TRINITY_DN14260_c0_g1~~TRINITY_DN14260_c0_g1_i1.p1  ORF type:complete len:541 (+),score=136.33 TRINITY_DN14260_c0_g1_i1:80-1702(+)
MVGMSEVELRSALRAELGELRKTLCGDLRSLVDAEFRTAIKDELAVILESGKFQRGSACSRAVARRGQSSKKSVEDSSAEEAAQTAQGFLEMRDCRREARAAARNSVEYVSKSYSKLPDGTAHEMAALEFALVEGSENGPTKPVEPSRLRRLAQSRAFEWFGTLLIISNAVWVGFQTDYAARHQTMVAPAYFFTVDNLFCLFFVAELAVKIGSSGRQFFTKMPEAKWNWFDVVVVGSQLFEVIANLFISSGFSMKRILNTIRILRMVRVLRVARVASSFGELRKLVASVTASLVPLSWTLLLIFLLTYAFAILITYVVTEECLASPGQHSEHRAEIEHYYGDLWRAMYTLYMIISDGVHWGEVMEPVEAISPLMKPAVCLFVAFQLFAMMNVITAYFVDAALQSASADERDEVAKNLLDALAHETHQTQQVEDVVITREGFNHVVNHELMYEFLKILGIEPEEASHLFDLIDTSGSGSMKARDFVSGCAKLVGPARAEMTARISFEQRQLMLQAETHYEELKKMLTVSLARRDPQVEEIV